MARRAKVRVCLPSSRLARLCVPCHFNSRHFYRFSDTCGGYIRGDNGTIYSPNFPQLYPSGKRCVWEIEANPGYQITLNFTHLNIEGMKVGQMARTRAALCRSLYRREGCGQNTTAFSNRLCSFLVDFILSQRPLIQLEQACRVTREVDEHCGFLNRPIAKLALSLTTLFGGATFLSATSWWCYLDRREQFVVTRGDKF